MLPFIKPRPRWCYDIACEFVYFESKLDHIFREQIHNPVAESQWQVADLVAKKQENTKTWQQQISFFQPDPNIHCMIQVEYKIKKSICKYKQIQRDRWVRIWFIWGIHKLQIHIWRDAHWYKGVLIAKNLFCAIPNYCTTPFVKL